MKRLFLVVGTAVVVLPWLAGARAQADAIQWTASMSMPGGSGGDGGINIYSQNFGQHAAIGLDPGPTTSGTNSGSVVLATLSDFDTSSSFTPATFGGPSANYSLSLMLRDVASGASGSLTFRGNLSGSINLAQGFGTVGITNTILGPTTQTLTLGGNLYTVTIGSFVPPAIPNDPNGVAGPTGSISASIAAQPAINSAPEPSSLVLACLGLPSLGLARWFRRRRKDVDSTVNQA